MPQARLATAKTMKKLMILLCLLAGMAFGQTYSLSPYPSLQFFAANGSPLAGGLVYTYQAGTTTPLATYEDSQGLTPNANPIVLDSSGHPTNGSNPVGLWLTNNTAYKICISDSNNIPQYCIDNINNHVIASYTDVTALWQGTCNSSTWLRGDGFCLTIPGGGNVSVNSPFFNAGRIPIATAATTLANGPLVQQTLTNSPLGSGINYLQMNLSPYKGLLDMGSQELGMIAWEVADQSGTATGGLLYKINGSNQAVKATTTDIATPLYIAAGDYSGFAQLSVAGESYCTFDGGATVGHIVVASTTVAGQCHDAGLSPPGGRYIIGYVASTAGGVTVAPNFSALATGNVTTSGFTVGYIPVATTPNDIENSFLEQVSGATVGPDYIGINDQTTTYGSGLLYLGSKSPQGLMSGRLLVTSGTANHLVKLQNTGGTGQWVAATTSDTNILVVPLVSTNNDSGGSLLAPQFSGMATIVDDGTPCTPGDIVVASNSTAATIHDTGSTAPTAGTFPIGVCVIGSSPDLVLLTVGGFGTTPPGGSSGQIQYNNSGAFGGKATVGSGSVVQSSPTFATLTDAATVTWAVGSSLIASADLTFTVHSGSRTLNITGLVSGGTYALWMKQDGTGGEGLTLGTGCTWKVAGGGGGAITPSSGANAVDVLTFQYDGTNCYAVLTKNYT